MVYGSTIYEPIPRISIIRANSDAIDSNSSFNTGLVYTSYPPNSAIMEMMVGIANFQKERERYLKYIFPLSLIRYRFLNFRDSSIKLYFLRNFRLALRACLALMPKSLILISIRYSGNESNKSL